MIDPEAGVAACLLTNSAESEILYREVFNEVFGALAGVTMPASPRPAYGVPGSGGDVWVARVPAGVPGGSCAGGS